MDMGTENISHYLCTGDHSVDFRADASVVLTLQKEGMQPRAKRGERDRERLLCGP